jgi:hypothetical protein
LSQSRKASQWIAAMIFKVTSGSDKERAQQFSISADGADEIAAPIGARELVRSRSMSCEA